MTMVLDIISWICFISGGIFLVLGAIGIIRLPDVFSRMHPTGLIDTMGTGLLILGMMLQVELGLVTIKLALIMVFIFFTSPTTTHALARAALGGGLSPLVETKSKPNETNKAKKADEPEGGAS